MVSVYYEMSYIAVYCFGVLSVVALRVVLQRSGLFFMHKPLHQHNSLDSMDFGLNDQQKLCLTTEAGRILFQTRAFKEALNCDSGDYNASIAQVLFEESSATETIQRLIKGAQQNCYAKETVSALQLKLDGVYSPESYFELGVERLRMRGTYCMLWSLSDSGSHIEKDHTLEELQTIVDTIDFFPLGLVQTDAKGTILYANARFSSWIRVPLEKLYIEPKSLHEFLEGFPFTAAMEQNAHYFHTDVFQTRLLNQGQGGLEVKAYVKKVLLQGKGEFGLNILLTQHETQSGHSLAVNRYEESLMHFIERSPVAIAMINADGKIFSANRAFLKLLGLPICVENPMSSSCFYELSLWTFINPNERRFAELALQQAALGVEDVPPFDTVLMQEERSIRMWVSALQESMDPFADDIEVMFDACGGQTNDGGQILPKDQFSPTLKSHEHYHRVIVYALDITTQRQLEQQIAQAQKMDTVGQLAGGIAHDFNNVLQAIIGYSDLLLNSHQRTDSAFHDIMQIKQNANRAASLVRQLLAFSRRQTLRPEIMHVGECLTDLTLLLKRLLGEHIQLELKQTRDVWPIKADVNQFEQVIVNLAVNSRDAMPEGGQLCISTQNITYPSPQFIDRKPEGLAPGDYVLIEVIDTGSGIPQNLIEKIFEPFFTTKEIGQGTGLGLSTVFGIVKQSGGGIEVESKEDEGTVFRIYFPRYQNLPKASSKTLELDSKSFFMKSQMECVGDSGSAHPADAQLLVQSKPNYAKPMEVPQGMKDLTGNGTILLVEDEDPVRAVNSRALSARGYKVIEASSGIEALKVIADQNQDIDLVVSDVVMPGMDGPTLLKQSRQYRKDLKIIFVSGYAENAFKKNLPENEAYNFLAKPFSLKQLVETVKKVVEQ